MNKVCVLLVAHLFVSNAFAADLPKIAPADLSAERVFYGALNEPPKGRILHGWGQFSQLWNQGGPSAAGDEADLKGYEKAVEPHRPAMFSFYSALDNNVMPPFIERYKKFTSSCGGCVTEIGLYFQSAQQDVAEGMRDPQVILLGDALHETQNPVLLRIGYEFNNPRAQYDPGKYIRSFRAIVGRLHEVHADNVAAVWNATPTGFSKSSYMKWYPGDDVVDWWSVNIFQLEDFDNPDVAAFLDRAREHHKPVLIGEASPVLSSKLPTQVRGPASQDEAVEWYAKLIELMRRSPEIQAVSLISLDWRHDKSIRPSVGWPDARITKWPRALAIWKAALADPRFINANALPSIRLETRQASP